MNESEEGVNCPCCGGRIERFPDQDGSCDYCCERCTWHQFVPADVNTTEMEDLSTAAKSETLAGLTIDLELLKQQAAILGKVVDGGDLHKDERYCLEGLWEFVHRILDGAGIGGHQVAEATIVLFVKGGVVQGVEGDGPARVILCDFDVDEGQQAVGGRPCVICVWESPEAPSQEFHEVLSLVERMD